MPENTAMTAAMLTIAASVLRTMVAVEGLEVIDEAMAESVRAGHGLEKARIAARIQAGLGQAAQVGPAHEAADGEEGHHITDPGAGKPKFLTVGQRGSALGDHKPVPVHTVHEQHPDAHPVHG